MQSKSMKAFQFGIKMNTWVNTKWYMVDLNSAWKLLKMTESTAKRSRAVFIAIPIWWKSYSRNRIPIVTHTSRERSYIYRPRESIGLTLKSKKEADPSRQNCTLERSPGEKKLIVILSFKLIKTPPSLHGCMQIWNNVNLLVWNCSLVSWELDTRVVTCCA